MRHAPTRLVRMTKKPTHYTPRNTLAMHGILTTTPE